MKTILAPIDFSSASNAIVAHAAALARVFRGRIVLLSVVQSPVIMSDDAPPMGNIAGVVATGGKTAVKRLAKLRDQLAGELLAVETELATGSPIQAIVDTAKRRKADYIVMGSHGHTALYDLVVGSTTHGVLKRAQCPVIIVPAENPRLARRQLRG